MSVPDSFSETISIRADAQSLWHVLTDRAQMESWLGEPSMQISVQTSWQPGSELLITGSYHGRFENKGRVLAFEPRIFLSYSHLSSVSRLPDKPESYSILEFRLSAATAGCTALDLRISHFPTETIYRHLAFYWKMTLRCIRALAEQQAGTSANSEGKPA